MRQQRTTNPVVMEPADMLRPTFSAGSAVAAVRDRLRSSVPGAPRGIRLVDRARRFAHDFRNLLLVIETRVELAQMDAADNPEATASLSAARQALAQARELVRQLDDSASEMQTSMHPVDLAEVVSAVADDVGTLLPPDVCMEVEAPAGAWIQGDAAQLDRLVRNLALNARDAMPQGGCLKIAVRARAGGAEPAGLSAVRLLITDTGIGMDASTRCRIFEPYFTTKSERGGTGLGLSIVREIAEAHGGFIEVESQPGCGTTVAVSFPAHRTRLAMAKSTQPVNTPGLVLIVGADERLRTMTNGSFGASGPAIHFAGGSREALRVLERCRDAVRCMVVDAATVPAEEVAMLRSLRCWRGRRGFVLLMPAGVSRRRLSSPRGECVLMRPLVGGELERSVREALESVN